MCKIDELKNVQPTVISLHQACNTLIPDINECETLALNNCEHQCANSDGAYTCQCDAGFTLHANGKSCNGTVNKCQAEHSCTKHPSQMQFIRTMLIES